MGSLQSSIRCPLCGGRMMSDYYYRTGEESRFCHRCGISQAWTIERDDTGAAKRDESGKVIGKYSENGGYGVAYIAKNGGPIGMCYSLTEPLSEKDKEDFLKYVAETGAENESYLVTFNRGTLELTSVFGKMPPDFEDELDA